MRLMLELTGTSPLLMHNIRLADPDDEFTTEIQKLTSKRTKTKTDRDEIARLEWYGGLYVDAGMPVFPTAGVKKCIAETAKVRKLGKAVERALIPLDGVYLPVDHDGPKSIDELSTLPAYRLRSAVGVSGKRVIRIRPRFPVWSVSLSVELLTDVMDADTFADLVRLAGMAEGLGDGRRIGYGRFGAEVKPA